MTRPELREVVSRRIVMSEDMMKFKTIELLLMLSYLLAISCHVGITSVQFPHDLVDNELRFTTDVKPLDPKNGSDAQAVEEGLIFCHIVYCVEMLLNHMEESISHGGGGIRMTPPPPH
jgi:hypothetical protein